MLTQTSPSFNKLSTWFTTDTAQRHRTTDGLGVAFRLLDDGCLLTLSRRWPDKPTHTEVQQWHADLENAARSLELEIYHRSVEQTLLELPDGRRRNLYRLRCFFVWPQQGRLF